MEAPGAGRDERDPCQIAHPQACPSPDAVNGEFALEHLWWYFAAPSKIPRLCRLLSLTLLYVSVTDLGVEIYTFLWLLIRPLQLYEALFL
jgi:hypothetical protein